MEYTLQVINETALTTEEKAEIDVQIDKIIAQHKNNRYEVNRLAFESVAALTESKNYSEELSSQGFFKRIAGNITGKNRRLQGQIDASLARAQYASQQTLQKLAEQNLMSFELITAVNNKLNSALVEVDEEINKIYGTLVTFFKRTKSDIIQLETRVDRLERNVNLLNWQNSIEYQMWNGIEYSELDDAEKIVCLTRDFYDITNGKWTTSDLLLLKTAMATIGLPPKGEISYKSFIDEICENKLLAGKLFGLLNIDGMENYPEYITVTAGIQKKNLLDTNEAFLVNSTASLMKKHGCEVSASEIREEMLTDYTTNRAQINIDKNVNLYDFILELLYNLEQISEIGKYMAMERKVKELETLYAYYRIKEAFPLAQELADYGFTKAKYILALIYETGHEGISRDYKKVDELLDECIEVGYSPAIVRRFLPLNRNIGENAKDEISPCLESIKALADLGDAYAAEEYARCCINFGYWGIKPENDYVSAIEYFKKAPLVLSKYGLAKRYDNGNGVEKDLRKALELYLEAAEIEYANAEYYVGNAYQYGYGCEVNNDLAFKYYERAERHGNYDAINELGNCFSDGRGIEKDEKYAYELFKKGAELGILFPTSNVGWCYHYGHGVDVDGRKAIEYYEKAISIDSSNSYSFKQIGWVYYNGVTIPADKTKAKEYFQKAADLGNEDAKKALEENF